MFRITPDTLLFRARRMVAFSFLVVFCGIASYGCAPAANSNNCGESATVGIVEGLGGVCARADDLLDYAHPDWLADAPRNAIVEVAFQTSAHPINDNSISRLAALKELRRLNVSYGHITDRGIRLIATQFPELRDLNLCGTPVTDAGIIELARLNNLACVDLGNTGVTDIGMEGLSKVRSLIKVNLGSTKITDRGLRILTRSNTLTSVGLGNTAITDNGLKELIRLKVLAELALNDTSITDKSIDTLIALPRLRHLNVINTAISAQGRALLNRTLPNCELILEAIP